MQEFSINDLSSTVIPFIFAFSDSCLINQFFLAPIVSDSAPDAKDRPVSARIKFSAQHIKWDLVGGWGCKGHSRKHDVNIEETFASIGSPEVMREQMANRSIYNLLYERS